MNSSQDYARLHQSQTRLLYAVQNALRELGVPNENTPAPVANAVEILRNALTGFPGASLEDD